jgi:hypothetical protein
MNMPMNMPTETQTATTRKLASERTLSPKEHLFEGSKKSNLYMAVSGNGVFTSCWPMPLQIVCILLVLNPGDVVISIDGWYQCASLPDHVRVAHPECHRQAHDKRIVGLQKILWQQRGTEQNAWAAVNLCCQTASEKRRLLSPVDLRESDNVQQRYFSPMSRSEIADFSV